MPVRFRFFLRRAFLAALLPCMANAGGPGDTGNVATERCPGLVDRLAFEVAPVSPEARRDDVRDTVIEQLAAARLLAQSLHQPAAAVPQQQIEADIAGIAADAAKASAAPDSVGSVAIAGLVKWMEKRAAAEVRLWMVDTLQARLCNDNKTYFPETCRLMSASDELLSAAYSGEALVRSLRLDLPYVPACAIHNRTGSPVGYQLHSIYSQFMGGTDIEWLLYGLANKPFGDQATGSAEHARLLLPVFAYAAMLDTLPYRANRAFATQFFVTRFNTYSGAATLCSDGSCSLSIDSARLAASLDAIEKSRKALKAVIGQLGAIGDDKPERRMELFREVGLLLAAQMTLAAEGAAPASARDDTAKQYLARLDAAKEYMGALLRAHDAIVRREYASALAELVPVSGCLAEADASDGCRAIVGERGGASYDWLLRSAYTAALLADADDADDFEQTLDDLASPVGAYKRRHETAMWSINGYFGMDVSENRVRIHRDALPDINDRYIAPEVFAPVGVTWSTPCATWACGVHVQLLNLGVLAGDYRGRIERDEYTLDSETNTSLRSVFSPGIYGVFSPSRRLPLTVGLGYSWGPYDYKTATLPGDIETTADRTGAISVFVALDLVIFGF